MTLPVQIEREIREELEVEIREWIEKEMEIERVAKNYELLKKH